MSYEDMCIRESVGDGTIDPDDVCLVCDKRNCECPPEDDEQRPRCDCGAEGEWHGPRDGRREFYCQNCYDARQSLKSEFMRPGAKEIGFPSLLESAEDDRREILNAQVLSMFLAFCVVQCVAFAVAMVVAT